MEKRKVRIYKSHDGEGKYINKTRQFLEKAQMGMQTQNESADVEQQLQSVKYYIKGLKNESVDDNQILKVLISKGLKKDIATALIVQVSEELEKEERKLEEEADAENQPNAEETEGGQEETNAEEKQAEEEEDYESAGYDEAIAEDDDYMNPNMEYGYGGRVGKKKFTNNVLKLLKKQEGGEEKALGQGSRFDNMNNDVSTKKSSFLEKIKEISNKAAVDELYEKMIGSNNPELIESANKMAEERNKPAEGTFEEAQSGGFIGDKQPDMFMYGGTDMPFYEADALPEAKRGIISGKAYNAKTKEEYKDSFEGLNPYAKTVHKRGLFGRPKQWTEYYSKSTGKPIVPTDKDKNLKHGVEKELWDDLSGKAKREIRRGDRQLGREARRGAKSLAEDAKFNKGVHAEYRYDSEEDLARDQKRSDDAWDKDKSFVSDIDKSDNFPYKGNVYLTRDEKGKRFDSPFIVAGPDPGFTEEDYDSKNMIDYEQQQIDEAAAKEASEEKTLLDQIAKEDALAKEEMDLDAERESMIPFEEKENDARTRLKAFYDDRTDDETLSKDKLRLANQFNNLKHFRPDDSKNMELIKAKYDKSLFEEPDREITADEVQSRMQVEDRMDDGFFRYGGLPKAQTGPPDKKPSDPTTNTGDLSGMLKPAPNPNTLMGVSTPFMNQNLPTVPGIDKVKTVTMDPNQTKDQKITSLDFSDPKNDDIIAVDKQRAPSNFTGEDGVNAFNVGATALTGFMNNLDSAKQQKEMYDNNFTSDNMYAASNSKDRGDYVDYGQQLGQFRYDQMGSDTSGRFAYGQEGGYMQDGGFTEGDEVDMTEEELEEFLANGGEVEYL